MPDAARRAGDVHLARSSAVGYGPLRDADLSPVAWLGWLLYRTGASDPMAWFAVPEFVAALAFGAWVFVLALERYRRDTGNRRESLF